MRIFDLAIFERILFEIPNMIFEEMVKGLDVFGFLKKFLNYTENSVLVFTSKKMRNLSSRTALKFIAACYEIQSSKN